MKVHLDIERCQGHGRCYDLAAHVFAANDEGRPQLLVEGDLPLGLRVEARAAADNCPECALDLSD